MEVLYSVNRRRPHAYALQHASSWRPRAGHSDQRKTRSRNQGVKRRNAWAICTGVSMTKGKHKKCISQPEKGAEQICRPDSVHREYRWAIIPLGRSLLTGSSHLPACTGGPPVWPLRPNACLFDVAPDRGYRVSPCYAVPCKSKTRRTETPCQCAPTARPHNRLVSVALFLGFYRCQSSGRYRTAVSRYPALWSPDLPR